VGAVVLFQGVTAERMAQRDQNNCVNGWWRRSTPSWGPLAKIIGHAEILQDDAAAMPERLRETVEVIARAADDPLRLAGVLSDLADLESHTRISKSYGNIAALVRDVIEGFTARATGRDLDLAIAPDRLTATIDPSQVERAVAVLLDAVTYAPNGSRIEVEATATAEYVDIQVRDTGTGIPPADLPRLVQPFERGDHAVRRSTARVSAWPWRTRSRPPRRRAAHEPTRTVRPVCHASTAGVAPLGPPGCEMHPVSLDPRAPCNVSATWLFLGCDCSHTPSSRSPR
jgi:signal transduction histidine kinase